MTELNIEEFKKHGLKPQEIKLIVESEKQYLKTGKTFSFEEVKRSVRKKVSSKDKIYA